MADPTPQPEDGYVYDREEWEGWRRDAGCDCTAPDSADCARYCTPSPRQTRECPCHYLSRRLPAPADAAVRPLDRPTPTPADTETPNPPAGRETGTRRLRLDQHTDDTLDALYTRLGAVEATVADYEQRLAWHTTCTGCARNLDSAYAETRRAEDAEAERDAYGREADRLRRDWTTMRDRAETAEQADAVRPSVGTGHVYLSTGCLHDRHDYCQNTTGLNGAKRASECKFCAAKCQCPCHAADTATRP